MKNKLRKIVVENETYLWQRKHFHVNKCEEENICVEKITIYLNGYKKSPLNIYFENDKQTSWKVDESQGLLIKYTVIKNKVIIESVNLNKPSTIEKIIRYYVNTTWKPKENNKLEINNAINLISEFGIAVEVNIMERKITK